VFTPALIGEVKFGVNQTIYHTANLSPVPFGVAVSGFSALTGSSTTDYPSKTFDSIDDVSWERGRHVIKFGFETRWIFLNQGTSQSGTLTYNSAASFETNNMGSASYTSILPLVRQRKTQYFGYVQDEWKATASLTITAGVRYNFFKALHAIGNDDFPFDFGTCGGYCPRTDSFFHPRYNDIDPRLGLVWAHGNTVLRAGAGIYHTDGQEDDQNLPISNTVDRYAFSNTSFPALSFPLTPFLQYAEAGGLGVVSPRDLDRNRKDDTVDAWTASVQRKLPFNIFGTASYLGNKGTHILTTTYVNLVNPRTAVAPYPAFGPVSWRGDVGNSTFHALQFNLRRAFQSGFLLSANYMWSHSINDGSIGGGESDTPQDSFCRSCDKASSDDDVRQVFNLSAVYQLPFGAGKHYLSSPGMVAELCTGRFAHSAGWIHSGRMDKPAPGSFGDLGRNAFRAPRLMQLDLGLSKDVPFSERINVRFRADAFNVFNRAQYGAPNADLSQTSFGVITTTVSTYATGRGTPRELQLSAKISF
jgi:hypothetical protein